MKNLTEEILQDVLNGRYDISFSNGNNILVFVESCLNNSITLDNSDIESIRNILTISNILYNNTDMGILLLEDGVYDLLLELYKKYDPHFQVGAIPTPSVIIDNDKQISSTKEKINPIIFIPEENEDMLYYEELTKEKPLTKKDLLFNPLIFMNEISRRTTNTKHIYPKLVGSLDKCKFVLNKQAENKGVLDDDNVKVLERDFFQKHIMDGIIGPYQQLTMVLELKYDGTSVEAECDTRVRSARSRGDANENIAIDLTPLLGGFNFPHSKLDQIIGVKFEAIMNYNNLSKYNQLRNYNYRNCRTAINGLVSASDGSQFRDLITLVPLAVEIPDIELNRIEEIEFMNKMFYNGELLRYTVIQGNYMDCLFQIKKFLEEAEFMRSSMPFMYDGIVVSYLDQDIRDRLGRQNAINKYSMAVKFNALKVQTIFTGYTYTVGQDGTITPMIHYQPIEFFGTIHNKSSGHSYQRFQELNLRLGDIIDVEYTNDVMPYVTKPENTHNLNNTIMIDGEYEITNLPVPFITECPECEMGLSLSESGKTIRCLNPNCKGRVIARVVNMLQKLNLKDFSEESLKQIGKYRLHELLQLTQEEILFLGPTNSQKFIDRMNELKSKPIYDYEIMGALGFTSIAKEKWRKILNKFNLKEFERIIFNFPEELKKVKGIGQSTINVLVDEIQYFKDDIEYILENLMIITSKGTEMKTVRFTGFRNKELVDKLNEMGFDADDNAGVNKNTNILLVPYDGYKSPKVKKAGPDTIILSSTSIEETLDKIKKYL